MKFTFTIVHQNENQAHMKFLPGHYIEVQSRIKGQVVIRSYTPIEGNIVQSFSIFVKVYPDGLMSRHLVRFEIINNYMMLYLLLLKSIS